MSEETRLAIIQIKANIIRGKSNNEESDLCIQSRYYLRKRQSGYIMCHFAKISLYLYDVVDYHNIIIDSLM